MSSPAPQFDPESERPLPIILHSSLSPELLRHVYIYSRGVLAYANETLHETASALSKYRDTLDQRASRLPEDQAEFTVTDGAIKKAFENKVTPRIVQFLYLTQQGLSLIEQKVRTAIENPINLQPGFLVSQTPNVYSRDVEQGDSVEARIRVSLEDSYIRISDLRSRVVPDHVTYLTMQEAVAAVLPLDDARRICEAVENKYWDREQVSEVEPGEKQAEGESVVAEYLPVKKQKAPFTQWMRQTGANILFNLACTVEGTPKRASRPASLLSSEAIIAFNDEAILFRELSNTALRRRAMQVDWARMARAATSTIYRDLPLIENPPATAITDNEALTMRERATVYLFEIIATSHESMSSRELGTSFELLRLRLDSLVKSLSGAVDKARVAHGVHTKDHPEAEYDRNCVQRLATMRKRMDKRELSYEARLKQNRDDLKEVVTGYHQQEERIREKERRAMARRDAMVRPSSSPRRNEGPDATRGQTHIPTRGDRAH
jgi:hypothetical protein